MNHPSLAIQKPINGEVVANPLTKSSITADVNATWAFFLGDMARNVDR